MLKRKTFGQHVLDSHEDHLKTIGTPIESGDLAQVMCTYYLKELNQAVEDHAEFNREKLYFMVNTRKDKLCERAIKITIGVIDKPLEYLHQDLDLWEYDYRKDELKLLWSIPHERSFKNFLANKDKVCQKTLFWIYQYLKQKQAS
jgi:hypothetical protein